VDKELHRESLEEYAAIAKKTRTARVVRFFPDSDMRCQHDGLAAIAALQGIDVWNLKPGEFVVFANKSRLGLKIFAPGRVLCYLRSPDGNPLEMRTISLIPRFFNGDEFRYDPAVKHLLTEGAKKIVREH
jgi:hypothetical protein